MSLKSASSSAIEGRVARDGAQGKGNDSYDVTDLFVPDKMVAARHDTSLAEEVRRLGRNEDPRGESNSLATSPLTQYEVGQLQARFCAPRSLLLSTIDGRSEFDRRG